MKEISIDNITSEYLDNVNLKFKISGNFNDIILDFTVYGKVNKNLQTIYNKPSLNRNYNIV